MEQNPYKKISVIFAKARTQYCGVITAKYEDVVDVMYLPREKERIEKMAQNLGEPIVLSMGDIDILYIPDNEKAAQVFGSLIEGNEGWLPPISHDEESVWEVGDVTRGTLFSGASGSEPCQYWLDVYMGADISDIKEGWKI